MRAKNAKVIMHFVKGVDAKSKTETLPILSIFSCFLAVMDPLGGVGGCYHPPPIERKIHVGGSDGGEAFSILSVIQLNKNIVFHY